MNESCHKAASLKIAGLPPVATRAQIEAADVILSGQLKELKLEGRLAVLVQSSTAEGHQYAVGVYEPRPLPFQPDRLKLLTGTVYDDEPERAAALFSELV